MVVVLFFYVVFVAGGIALSLLLFKFVYMVFCAFMDLIKQQTNAHK